MREDIIYQVDRHKIVAIVRGVKAENCVKVAEALYCGGIRLMEVTFDLKNNDAFCTTAQAISAVSKEFEGLMSIGAGTVMNPSMVDIAVDAGAQYIISPDTNSEVIRRTIEKGMVSIPGAMTPSEIMSAYNAGADYIKLFPASVMGTEYIKAVLAPLSHVKLIAVGGINEKNAANFLEAGARGVGVSASLVNMNWIENGEFDKVTAAARKLVSAVNG